MFSIGKNYLYNNKQYPYGTTPYDGNGNLNFLKRIYKMRPIRIEGFSTAPWFPLPNII